MKKCSYKLNAHPNWINCGTEILPLHVTSTNHNINSRTECFLDVNRCFYNILCKCDPMTSTTTSPFECWAPSKQLNLNLIQIVLVNLPALLSRSGQTVCSSTIRQSANPRRSYRPSNCFDLIGPCVAPIDRASSLPGTARCAWWCNVTLRQPGPFRRLRTILIIN